MCVCVPARRQCATQASCCGTVSSCWGAVLVLWPGGECLWSWVLCDRHSTTDAAQVLLMLDLESDKERRDPFVRLRNPLPDFPLDLSFR